MAVLVRKEKKFLKFAERLKKVCCRNYSMDERLTTVAAEKMLIHGDVSRSKENELLI